MLSRRRGGKHPDSVAVLVFETRFRKRPMLAHLSLFPEFVRPACWAPRVLEHYGYGDGCGRPIPAIDSA